MKLKFCGANKEVTGSCHLLEIGDKKILVDCGMFQGSDYAEGKNFEAFPFKPSEIDAVLVTHSHLDHIGRIPKLIGDGFVGKIFATAATCDILPLELSDACEIMFYNHRKFQYPLLYTQEDVDRVPSFTKPVKYRDKIEVVPGVKATFFDAGHIFGSAFICVEAEGKKIVFSGDVGNDNAPIIKDTEALAPCDVLLIESTYGDRLHPPYHSRKEALRQMLTTAIKRGGTILIPSFSMERTQELLYELNTLFEDDHALPSIPVYLDSPLAIELSEVFMNYPEYYDDEALARVKKGDNFLDFPYLRVTRSRDESKQINADVGQKIIIAGAGMMNGGRIQHHALRYLSKSDTTLILVGYQAKGTVGQHIQDGDSSVKLLGEHVKVACKVETMTEFSGHADRKKLVSWVAGATKIPKQIFLVHGEEHQSQALEPYMKEATPQSVIHIPSVGEVVEIF